MALLKKVRSLSLEPFQDDPYSCPFFEWFLEHVRYNESYKKHPLMWFIKQEPTYEYWKIQCDFLQVYEYRIVSHATRQQLYADMKRWLIHILKKNAITGL